MLRGVANDLGLFPEAAEVGHFIAFLPDGQALYVLNPLADDSGHHEFVGECYVDGMMGGRAVDVMAEKGLEMTNLVLV
jgi:hypothetical protein